MNVALMIEAFPTILGGLPNTLMLAGISLAIGFLIATGVALMRTSPNPIFAGTAYGFVYLFRSTPLLVQIFLIYYGSGQFRPALDSVGLWPFFREAWFCALLALALNTGAYTSEIIRGGIQSVHVGQIEAAKAVGMSGLDTFRQIVFPQALRQALPAYGNEIILMVKSTSLASTITILEVTGQAKKMIASTFQPVEIFIIAGGIYLTLNFIISRLITFGERQLSPDRDCAGS